MRWIYVCRWNEGKFESTRLYVDAVLLTVIFILYHAFNQWNVNILFCCVCRVYHPNAGPGSRRRRRRPGHAVAQTLGAGAPPLVLVPRHQPTTSRTRISRARRISWHNSLRSNSRGVPRASSSSGSLRMALGVQCGLAPSAQGGGTRRSPCSARSRCSRGIQEAWSRRSGCRRSAGKDMASAPTESQRGRTRMVRPPSPGHPALRVARPRSDGSGCGRGGIPVAGPNWRLLTSRAGVLTVQQYNFEVFIMSIILIKK